MKEVKKILFQQETSDKDNSNHSRSQLVEGMYNILHLSNRIMSRSDKLNLSNEQMIARANGLPQIALHSGALAKTGRGHVQYTPSFQQNNVQIDA